MSKRKEPKARQPEKAIVKSVKKTRTWDWIIISLIALITFLLFSPAIRYDFVNWDDPVNITENRNVSELNANNIRNIFIESVIGGYNPLSTLSFAVEKHFFGLDPKAYHANNILLHVLCTMLVFLLIRRLGFSLLVAAIVALMFGIHPMRVESVAWATERKDVLYSLFFLLSALSYISYYKSRKLVLYFASLLLFILSLLSKIQAVSLPLVLILIDYYFENKFSLKQLLNKAPYFLLSLITGLLGIFFLTKQGSLETDSILPFFQRFFIGSFSLLVYIVKTIVPWEMSPIYPFPAKLSWMHFASLPVALGLAFLIWKMKRHRKTVVFGFLFFLVNIAFVLQVVGAGQGYLADRFTYLPYIGLFLIIAYLLEKASTGNLKIPIFIATGIFIIILGSLTAKQLAVWENSKTLFTQVIKEYPKVSVAHNNLGKFYRENNEYDKAIKSYTRAINLAPGKHIAYCNRGKAFLDIGKTEEGLADFNKCLSIEPDYAEALNNRGAALASKGLYEEAMADLDRALILDPDYPSAYSNRALAYYKNLEYEKAVSDISRFLELKPDDPDLINLRGLSYDQLKRDQEALADFNKAIALSPRQGLFYQNRSFYYVRRGEREKALADILKAESLGVQVSEEYVRALGTGN